MTHRFALVPLLLCILPVAAAADTIDIGLMSFDVVIPAGVAPGVNAIDLYDFTGTTYGPFAGLPYVVDPLDLDDAMLTVYFVGGGSSVVFQNQDLSPGELLYFPGSPQEFPSNTEIASAVLTATLSQTTFTLSDGSTFTALADISVDLLPSSGGTLEAGVDFAPIDAQSAGGSATPEPSPGILVSLGMLGLALWRKR
jgi:hypothetical protein